MSLSNDALKAAIEHSFFLMPEIPGKMEHLKIPGVRGFISPLSHPMANLVGQTQLSEAEADIIIQEVLELFAKQSKAFSWLVGPCSTPSDLPQRLQHAGFVPFGSGMAGMVLDDLNSPIRPNPEIQIEEITPEEYMVNVPIMARAYGLPESVARMGAENWLILKDRFLTRIYMAYISGTSEPVAFAAMLYLPEQPVVLLSGAATVEEQRGKGVYSSLVARRLADARSDGIEAAIIQAVRATSAPICARLGFKEICSLEMYAWTPETEQA